jgi:hypothetical protein
MELLRIFSGESSVLASFCGKVFDGLWPRQTSANNTLSGNIAAQHIATLRSPSEQFSFASPKVC